MLTAAVEVCKASIEGAKGRMVVKEGARAVSEREERALEEELQVRGRCCCCAWECCPGWGQAWVGAGLGGSRQVAGYGGRGAAETVGLLLLRCLGHEKLAVPEAHSAHRGCAPHLHPTVLALLPACLPACLLQAAEAANREVSGDTDDEEDDNEEGMDVDISKTGLSDV